MSYSNSINGMELVYNLGGILRENVKICIFTVILPALSIVIVHK
ncbi:MAG: hypothetical protein WCB89_07075 [Methanobacterium sp.]